MSDPIDPTNPNGWMQTLKPQGEIQGLPGDRESQLVALKGGGYMLVGSDNVVRDGNQQPIGAVTAATPEGLLTAPRTDLFPPGEKLTFEAYGTTCAVGDQNLVACIDNWHNHGFVLQASGSWAF